jgi:tight adherence protein C
MTPITYAAVAFLVVAGVTFATAAALLTWWPTVGRRRFEAPAAEAERGGSILRWGSEDRGAWRRTMGRLGSSLSKPTSARASTYRRRLGWAGFHDPQAVRVFFGAKVVCAVLAGLAYPLYGVAAGQVLSNLVLISYVAAVVGFFVPDYWLAKRVRVRQRDVLNALPDALDLLMVCVEAGMGFDAAVARVSEQPEVRKSPLHQEMLRMHLEMRAGRARDEALRALGERTGVEEVQALVGAFIQADRMGTSLGKTLRIYSDSTRVARRHRAEKQAYMAPLKMIFPTVVFLMPSFFLVAMAPSLLKLIEIMKTLGN